MMPLAPAETCSSCAKVKSVANAEWNSIDGSDSSLLTVTTIHQESTARVPIRGQHVVHRRQPSSE